MCGPLGRSGGVAILPHTSTEIELRVLAGHYLPTTTEVSELTVRQPPGLTPPVGEGEAGADGSAGLAGVLGAS